MSLASPCAACKPFSPQRGCQPHEGLQAAQGPPSDTGACEPHPACLQRWRAAAAAGLRAAAGVAAARQAGRCCWVGSRMVSVSRTEGRQRAGACRSHPAWERRRGVAAAGRLAATTRFAAAQPPGSRPSLHRNCCRILRNAGCVVADRPWQRNSARACAHFAAAARAAAARATAVAAAAGTPAGTLIYLQKKLRRSAL